MKKIYAVAPAFIILFCLIIVTTCFAESWVLWQKNSTSISGGKELDFWNIIEAYPNYKSCIDRKNIESPCKDGKLQPLWGNNGRCLGNTYFISKKDKKNAHGHLPDSIKYYCLPGTIDPRNK